MPTTLAVTLTGVGGLLTALGTLANRYHSRRFREHTRRLRHASRRDDTDAMHAELDEFSSDRRVDVAIFLTAAQPVGWMLLVIGVSLLITV